MIRSPAVFVHNEIIYDKPYLCFELGENKKILGLDWLPLKINELLPVPLSHVPILDVLLFSYTYSGSTCSDGAYIILSLPYLASLSKVDFPVME